MDIIIYGVEDEQREKPWGERKGWVAYLIAQTEIKPSQHLSNRDKKRRMPPRLLRLRRKSNDWNRNETESKSLEPALALPAQPRTAPSGTRAHALPYCSKYCLSWYDIAQRIKSKCARSEGRLLVRSVAAWVRHAPVRDREGLTALPVSWDGDDGMGQGRGQTFRIVQ
jgi:hypothetical protein